MKPKTKKSIRIGSALAKTRIGPHAIAHLPFPEVISEQRVFAKEASPCRKSDCSLVLKIRIIHVDIPEYAGVLFPSSYSKAQMPSISIAPSDALYRLASIQTFHPRTAPARQALKIVPPDRFSRQTLTTDTSHRLRITIISTYLPMLGWSST